MGASKSKQDPTGNEQERGRDEILRRLLKTPPQPRPKRDRSKGDSVPPKRDKPKKQKTPDK